MANESQQARQAEIVLVGCEALAPLLESGGMRVSQRPDLSSLTGPSSALDPRVIVLSAEAVGRPVRPRIDRLREAWPLVDVLVWAPTAGAGLVRDLLRAKARDVLLDPDPANTSKAILEVVESQQLMPRAAELGYEQGRESRFEGLLSRSSRMWDLFDLAARVAQTDAPVLILGETGTGKELLARGIHRLSERSGRFVAVNCASLTESLADAELFGHVRGSFTGATGDKPGLFRHADGGTLMLDEIGRVSLAVQHRLLRTLQEATVRPVGGHEELSVDVRLIAATSAPLAAHVESGAFREDLFYRLDVIRLEIPPLRERPEDIVFLFGQFAREMARQYELGRPDLTDGFLDALLEHDWPGNVRQLENFTERLLLTHPQGLVDADDFRQLLHLEEDAPRPGGGAAGPASAEKLAARRRAGRLEAGLEGQPVFDGERTLEQTLEPRLAELERRYLDECLRDTGGRVARSAQRAGISRRTLLRKMKRHGLDKADYR